MKHTTTARTAANRTQAPRSPAPDAPGSATPAGITVHLTVSKSTPGFERLHALVPGGAETLWAVLQDEPVNLRGLEDGNYTAGAGEHGAPLDVAGAFLLLARLWAWEAIALTSAPEAAALEIRPSAPNTTLNLGVGKLDGAWRATRFASLRHERDDAGRPDVFIENPQTTTTVRLDPGHAVRLAALFVRLMTPSSRLDLVDAEAGMPEAGGTVTEFLYLLIVAGIIEPVDGQGRLREDVDAAQRHWEHHDLLFHFRSRQGRHRHPMGAGFRFKGVLPSQPAIKPNPWRAQAIPLFQPNLHAVAACDPPFGMVLEGRRSTRVHDNARPISARQIGEFLYRTARVRTLQQTDIGELTSRPYPSGGASYELEIYLTLNHVADLPRGFYYYDPAVHALCRVSEANADMEALLHDAWVSAAQTCRPQVLITLASRFQRVSWKYEGMAYAVQLKNVGALYQTFYLVATAMNLGGCALGLGNAAQFAKLAGTDYLVESSVGEFMLGNPG